MPNLRVQAAFSASLSNMSNTDGEMRPLIQFVCDASQSATVSSRGRAEETVGKREY